MSVKPVPDGYHTVTPYLVVRGADRLLEFLGKAFGATETERVERPDGSVAHAEVRIGDSMVMLAEASDQYKPMPTMLYLYVENVDATYRRALEMGAVSSAEPDNQFYGDRSAGVTDPSGNQWYIATHVEDVAPDELRRRARAAMG